MAVVGRRGFGGDLPAEPDLAGATQLRIADYLQNILRVMYAKVRLAASAGPIEGDILRFPLCMAVCNSLVFTKGKRYRILGWMYVVPLLLSSFAKGREYYVAPAYPMLYAAGSVAAEAPAGIGEATMGEHSATLGVDCSGRGHCNCSGTHAAASRPSIRPGL